MALNSVRTFASFIFNYSAEDRDFNIEMNIILVKMNILKQFKAKD